MVVLELGRDLSIRRASARALAILGEGLVGRPLASLLADSEVLPSLRSLVSGGEEVAVDLVPGGGEARLPAVVWRDRSGVRRVVAVPSPSPASVSRAEKLAGVGRIAAQLAHQLNTPLGSILLSAQALQGDVDRPELQDDLAIIVEATRRCQRTVRRLQNFARSAGAQDDRINFCHLFHRVFHILGHAMEAAGIRLAYRIARGRYLVKGDPSELEHLVFALVENALDASPRGSTIEVSMKVEMAAGRLCFVIRDHGQGIPAGYEERIFEPFFTTKPEGKGTGLGLAIARRVVADHGGELVACNAPGGGAEFRLELPLSPVLVSAFRKSPDLLEVKAIPFESLQARARGEFAAGCEVIGIVGRTSRKGGEP